MAEATAGFDAADARSAVIAAARGYFAERRAEIDPFVRRHFGLAGSLRLHRSALGWDLARAPVNIALAPVHVAIRIGAIVARLLGASRVADRLGSRQILLRTAVAGEVERLVVTELLGLPWPGEAARPGDDALSRAIFSSPAVQELSCGGPFEAGQAGLERRMRSHLGEYAGARSALSEITTSLAVLAAGATAFQAMTPGMISLGPVVAAALVHGAAVASFPLGSAVGSVWYSFFSVDTPATLAIAITVALLIAGAVIAAFAGVLADPVQSRLGIHQRRLRRLVDSLERDFVSGQGPGFVAREHYVARVLDFADAAVIALRQLRG